MMRLVYPFLFFFLLIARTACGQTQVLSNRYFDIYYPAARSRIAEQVGTYGVEELERISRNLKLTAVKRITVSILEEETYKQRYGDLLPEWGVAFAMPEQNLILLIFPESFRLPSRLRFIVAHEIAHLLIHEQAATFLPRWFDEGLALYLSREPNLIDEMQLLFAVAIGGLIPLRQIEHSFPQTGRRARFAYIESASTIVFLVEEFGPSAFMDILIAARNENDFRAGFIKATAIDLPQFEMEWRTWIRKRFALAVLLRPNLLFAFAALFALVLGIVARLRRTRARGADEGTEE